MQITENHRDRLIYCDELSSWLAYEIDGETGIWEMISKDIMLSIIDRIVESQGIRGYGSSSYIENIEKKMRRLLVCKHWEEKNEKHLPFENGVLDLETSKFHQHAPGFRLTSKLPRQYNPLATSWSKTDQWLTEVVKGDEKAKELLLCYMAAVLRGRYDLQVFCYLIGSGGAGKSTFTNLLTQLVGEQNTVELDFDELDDKHEVIRLFGKRLLILADQDRVGRKIANFKKLTGGDRLSGRYLFKNSMSFQFKGLACVTSNPPNVFPASTAKWLLRRMRLVEFNGRFQPNYHLMDELEPELPGLTNYLLNLPEHHIENILKGRAKELTATTWEHQCRSDGLASWINDWLIQDENAFSIIGSNGKEWNDSEYNAYSSTLYGSYVLYCKQTGRTPKTTQNFSADLIEVTERILGWPVKKRRKRIAGKIVRGIEGIRLRTNDDDEQLLVEDTLYSCDNGDNQKENVTTERDRLEFPIDLGCDNFDHLITNEQQNELEKSLVALSVAPQNNIESNGQKVVTETVSSTTQAEKGLAENQPVVTAKNGSEVLSQVDYSTFPHLTSNDLRAKEKRAISIKKRMLACSHRNHLVQLRENAGYSPNEIQWVWKHSLTSSQKKQIDQAANLTQKDIFESLDERSEYDWHEIIQGIDLELVRLGWTIEQAQQYMKEKYGKHSRQLLEDHQLLSFWQDLQRMSVEVKE
ncbi:DNA primase family protein [Crocosphaera subtropica]|nr:phage/plasmid primase, P4 family [Crocosphaera subtropica]